MKPAREPAFRRPKPCASLKKPHESCPFAAPCGPRRKKNDRGQRYKLFPKKPPGSRFRFSRTEVQPSPGSSTIELPSAFFVESGAYPPDRELPDSPRQCSLPRACRHPPEGHPIGARKRRTPENTILSQPHCRRVSTDRPNCEVRGGVHLFIYNRHTPSGQFRVYRVTQLRTDGVRCRESAGTGPVNFKVVPNECCLGRSP